MMIDDSKTRERILLDNDSLVILAGAGSGKTTIMTEKIRKDLKNNKSHYTVAAITFMRKAAKEIRSKLGKGYSNVFIGSNDSFVEKEIISPFIYDVYTNLGGVSVRYDRKFSSYSDGIKLLKTENILGVYNSDVRNKNFKFDLALDVLMNSKAAAQYLKAKYSKVFIDEYQDSDQSMHELFMFLIDELKIKLFIVGDEKQSIYKWRGAYPQNFISLASNKKFNNYQLTRNFRSHIDIQNFSNSLNKNTSENIELQDEVHSVVLVRASNELTRVEIVKRLIESLEVNMEREISILINTNTEIIDFVNEINNLGYNFSCIPKTPIDNPFVNGNFLHELASYYFNEDINEYDLIETLIGSYTNDQIIKLKGILKDFKVNQHTDKILEETILDLYNFFEVTINIEEIKALTQTLEDEENSIAFNNSKIKHKVMTVFSSKGLEFEQVISFSSFYFGKNNYGYKVERFEDHYVCITRAKEKIIMVNESIEYVLNINELIKGNTGLSLNDLTKVYKID
ncbi:UvrD-helicase domain-containing protein [Bacillus pseudomycoides]|uniref:UvrD-helicase domain-containing protein n=1 Tax=Bacillus pseudomycoides TaxID=64104 RepID=UPI003D64CD12